MSRLTPHVDCAGIGTSGQSGSEGIGTEAGSAGQNHPVNAVRFFAFGGRVHRFRQRGYALFAFSEEMKAIQKVFEAAAFQALPKHPSSRTLLPLNIRKPGSLRFVSVAKSRESRFARVPDPSRRDGDKQICLSPLLGTLSPQCQFNKPRDLPLETDLPRPGEVHSRGGNLS